MVAIGSIDGVIGRPACRSLEILGAALQQGFTVKIAQHGGSKAITEERCLLLDLQRCQQLAGLDAVVKRSWW
jgi:hypothetical protein